MITSRGRVVVVAGIVMYLVTFLVALPLLWIVLLSFEDNSSILSNPFSVSHLGLQNYRLVLSTLSLVQLYKNTAIVTVGSVLVVMSVSFMVSYAISRMAFGWPVLREVLRYTLLAGLAVPVYILLFPVFRLEITLHVFGTYASLILPYVAVQIPFDTLIFTGFLRGFPDALEEAAVLDGCGLFRLCLHVVLPVMRPALATVAIFNVVYAWNEFPFAVTLIQNTSLSTIALGVSGFQGAWGVDYGAMMAASTLVLIPQLLFYAVFQKQVVAGMTLGAVTG